VPLNETDHLIVAKAAEQFGDADAKHERIRAIDDHVLFKVKVQRWRGAVWIDADLQWLVAAGRREDGSSDDFYATREDHVRYRAEAGVRFVRRLRTTLAGTLFTTTRRKIPAIFITASEACRDLFRLIKKVNDGHEAIEAGSKHGNAVPRLG
jgi:hypothetical protein